VIMQNPPGLELRRMQMITEVGAEQNTMIIVMMPSEFVAMARGIAEAAKNAAGKACWPPRCVRMPLVVAMPIGLSSNRCL
jgi:hypothetical protein